MKPAAILWRISVTTTLEAEEAVTELLVNLTGQPASMHFSLETQTSLVSVFGPETMVSSPGLRDKISAGIIHIQNCGLPAGPGKISITRVRREDWAESWKRHFKALEIGRELLVKPGWIKRPPRKNQSVVILDPGLSFGTGQHPTTSFCLREIVRWKKPECASPSSFLDIGTGSGILAIAAQKLGYQPVIAFDFDPEAVRVARENARKNHVERKIKIYRGDVMNLPLHPPQKFDLVCANLISDLLISERKRIVAQLAQAGTLVLAGILKSEFARVQDAFERQGLKLLRANREKEWCSGSFANRKQ